MKKDILHKKNGFSLIEVVLMIVLLGIAIPPLANLMKTNLKGTGALSQVSNATFVARQRMEQIIADFNSPSPNGGFAVITASGRYSPQTVQGVTTSVSISTAIWSGNLYASITVTASVPNMTGSNISLVAYLPQDINP